MPVDPQYIGPDAPGALAAWGRERGVSRYTLVCDERTWQALGAAVSDRLAAEGADVQTICLAGPDVVADEQRIVEILLGSSGALPDSGPERVYLAVGSGTLCDLTRFVSHRTGRPFVALPTAPSVDAYTSLNAPLVIRGMKQTIDAQQPLAVFADIGVLCNAPPAMIAAGAGDVLGKYTALADWRLGALLWDEDIDEGIVADMYAAADAVAGAAEGIGRREAEAVTTLMRALLDSGSAMARWHNSRPASGSEHHLSHYWEMMLQWRGRPALFHGAKVGVASVLIARAYARVRATTRDEAAMMISGTRPPDPEHARAMIRLGYGPTAAEVIASQGEWLTLWSEHWTQLQADVLERWDEVLAIAADVPAPEAIAARLREAGAPVDAAELGLSVSDVDAALSYGHYMRNRFTVRRLELALGLR